MSVLASIGLGSNLGDRAAILRSALRALEGLEGVRLVAASAPIETEPQGPPGQGRYLNAAAVIETDLAPRALLEALHAIEAAHGRTRAAEPWGPRTLDLDLLMYGDLIVDEDGLRIPHPRMHRRLFVLEPLASIAPQAVHPRLGVTVECLRRRLAAGGGE